MLVLKPVQDTFLDAAFPDVPKGDDPYLRVGTGPWGGTPTARPTYKRTLIQFDLSQIPADAQVISATLRLYKVETSFPPDKTDVVRYYTLHRILDEWDASTETWNTNSVEPRLDYDRTVIAQAEIKHTDKTGGPEWVEWDVTSDVRAGGSHYGWMIKDRDELITWEFYTTAFCSSEEDYWQAGEPVDCVPQLVITYTRSGVSRCPPGSSEIEFTYDQFTESFDQDEIAMDPFTIEPVFLNDQVPYELGLRVSATFTEDGTSSYMFTMMLFTWDFTYVDPDPTAQDDQYWEGTSPDDFTWEPLAAAGTTGGPKIRIFNGWTKQDIRFLRWSFCVETSGQVEPPTETHTLTVESNCPNAQITVTPPGSTVPGQPPSTFSFGHMEEIRLLASSTLSSCGTDPRPHRFKEWRMDGLAAVNPLTFRITGDTRAIAYYEPDTTGLPPLLDHTMAKDVQADYPYDPINPTYTFSRFDLKAVSWLKFGPVYKSHQVEWKWYDPDGKFYLSHIETIEDPKAAGHESWEWYKVWAWIRINGYEPMRKPGTWRVDVYVDGEKILTEQFIIKGVGG